MKVYESYLLTNNKGFSMTKDEFAKKIKEQLNLSSQAVALEVINKVADTIVEAVKSGDEITLPNVGKFSAVERSARKGRNPLTGETIEIPAKKAVKFKVSNSIKKAINE